MNAADARLVWVLQRAARCPVCGAAGFRRIRRVGDDLVHVCRSGHPYFLPRLDVAGWQE